MGDNETIGIATIALGLLLVIGVVRGTWKKLFADLGLSGPGLSGGSGPTPASPPTAGVGNASATTTSLGSNNFPPSQGNAVDWTA